MDCSTVVANDVRARCCIAVIHQDFDGWHGPCGRNGRAKRGKKRCKEEKRAC